MNLILYSEDYDFSPLASAFEGEFQSDIPLAAEIITVGEEEIKSLNLQFRNIDAVTDVLSFPALENIKGKMLLGAEYALDTDENGNLFIGSIAICLTRAKQQAEEFGHSEKREINYLAAHGLCHLLGYDHMTDSDKAEMRAVEERVLAKFNMSRGDK